jgi:hypothetical protein
MRQVGDGIERGTAIAPLDAEEDAMRFSPVSLAALCGFLSCTPERPLTLSPMDLEVPVVDELALRSADPESVCEALQLGVCPPPAPPKPPERPKATAVIEPRREAQQAPVVEPEPQGKIERPRLPAARSKPKATARRTAPLVPRAHTSPMPPPDEAPSMLARNVALGVGGGGLLVSAVALGANVEARSNVGYAIGGVALGIGVVGLATAGILTLVQDDAGDEDARVRVRPTGDGLRVSF